MSTREQTRRDLKELARLAAAMPRESSSSSDRPSRAPGASRITVPPTVASVPPPPVFPRPPRAFSVSGPPPARSIASTFDSAFSAAKESLRLRAGVLLGAGIVAAMVGGLALGKSLSSQTGAGSANAPLTPDTIVISGPAGTPPPGPVSSGMPPAPAPNSAVVSPAASVLEVCAPVATFRAPRPNHHAETKVAPKPSANSTAMSGAPTTKGLGPKTHDSLDDLIRKAASN